MYKILNKERLCENTIKMVFEAPEIAKKARPGQFIIFRIDELGERVPLTIHDFDPVAGTIAIVFQEVGTTTIKLGKLEIGDTILDLVGPLGKPTEYGNAKRVAVIGGGLGCAIAYPQAKFLHNSGVYVDIIAGFRNNGFVILDDKMQDSSAQCIITTDDGSNGTKGFVTDALKKRIEEGANYDLVIAIGPLPMMKFVSLLTKEYNLKTVVSMNPIMIDGTGMCGCCRLNYNGEVKFACVDGPDFDGHKVDFDETIRRSSLYKDKERESKCNLLEAGKNG